MIDITKSDVLRKIGINIKRLRLLHGFSQENLANHLNKSINFVSLLENGKTGIAIQTLIDICNVLDVDANAIFDGVIPKAKTSTDEFITKSISMFDKNDKDIVTNLITYIANSKS